MLVTNAINDVPIIGYNVIEAIVQNKSDKTSQIHLVKAAFPRMKKREASALVDIIQDEYSCELGRIMVDRVQSPSHARPPPKAKMRRQHCLSHLIPNTSLMSWSLTHH